MITDPDSVRPAGRCTTVKGTVFLMHNNRYTICCLAIVFLCSLMCTPVLAEEDLTQRSYMEIGQADASYEYREFVGDTPFEPDPEVCTVLTIPGKGVLKQVYTADPYPGLSGWGSAPDGQCPTYSRNLGPLSDYIKVIDCPAVIPPSGELTEGKSQTQTIYCRVDPGEKPAQISFTLRPSLVTQYTSTWKQLAGSMNVLFYFSPDAGSSGSGTNIGSDTGSDELEDCPEVVLSEGDMDENGEFTIIAETRGIDTKKAAPNVQLSFRVNHVYSYLDDEWINGEYYDPPDDFSDSNGKYTLRVEGIPGDMYRIEVIVVSSMECPDYSETIGIEVPYTSTPEPTPTGHTTDDSGICKNRVQNGNFEDPQIMTEYETISAGSDIGGWTVTKGTVDLVESYWQASEGVQSLDLSGLEAGMIEQEINTYPGEYYTLSFDLAGSPDSSTVKEVTIYWDGEVIGTETFDNSAVGATRDNMMWRSNINYENLIASDLDTTTLAFVSTNPGGSDYWGPVIDNVRICNVISDTIPAAPDGGEEGDTWWEGAMPDIFF